MRILLINHYAGSPNMGMEFRPYYLAREWIKLGHEVDIIAADYSHLRQKNPEIIKDWQIEDVDGIRYHWLKTKRYDKNGIKRAITMVQFVGKIWLKAKQIAEEWKPDIIITSSTYPLDTYAGQRIRKFTKGEAQLIHEVHDMWPITLIELGHMKRNNPFVRLMQMGEDSFCRNSDKVVSLLCEAKQYFIKHGMQENKFAWVSNGIVLEEWKIVKELSSEHKAALEQLKVDGKFIICFFGSHTAAYALDYLIDAVQGLERDDVTAVFVGSGNYKPILQDRINDKKQERFVFLPPIPKQEIPCLLEQVDAIYVGACRNDMFRFGICMNKLFDAMMSGKPILYAVDAPNNYITEYGCGISVEPENVEALREGIIKLVEFTEHRRKSMGMAGRKAVLEHFTYEKLADQFLEVVKR